MQVGNSYHFPEAADSPLWSPVLMWKSFLHYWPFVRGIHQWLVDSPHKWPIMHTYSLDAFFIASLIKLLDKQFSWLWFETPWCSRGSTVMTKWLSAFGRSQMPGRGPQFSLHGEIIGKEITAGIELPMAEGNSRWHFMRPEVWNIVVFFSICQLVMWY